MKLLLSLAGGMAGAIIVVMVTRWAVNRNKHLVSPNHPPVESYKPVVDITV
jgi:hypothetical protein